MVHMISPVLLSQPVPHPPLFYVYIRLQVWPRHWVLLCLVGACFDAAYVSHQLAHWEAAGLPLGGRAPGSVQVSYHEVLLKGPGDGVRSQQAM